MGAPDPDLCERGKPAGLAGAVCRHRGQRRGDGSIIKRFRSSHARAPENLGASKRAQYRGTVGSISTDQASMPPCTLKVCSKPCCRKKPVARSDRTPW